MKALAQAAARGTSFGAPTELETALAGLRGEQEQLPPLFSAKRIDGKRSHRLARAGVEVVVLEKHKDTQTVLGLLAASRKTWVVCDAVGSRHPDSKDAALGRMDRHGAEIVTTEMVVFEWLQTAEHPHFRQVVALIK